MHKLHIYGKWCGPGYSGPEAPIDEVDNCCKLHDQCYDQLKPSTCSCDKEFLKCLESKRDIHTKKGLAALVMWSYFKLAPCKHVENEQKGEIL